MKDNLIIITGHYPYGHGETFLEDELRIAECYFHQIIIFSLDKNLIDDERYIPQNCTVIACRNKSFIKKYLLVSAIKMFSFKTINELIFSSKIYDTNFIKKIKKLYIYNYLIQILEKCFAQQKIDYENSIFYSYWLDSSAKFLVDLKIKHPDAVCIARAHGGDCFVGRGYQTYRREIVSKLDAIYPISKAGAEDIRSNFGKYFLKENVLRINRLGVLKSNENLNPYQNNPTILTIASCSNIIKLKRLDMIIDALSEITVCEVRWIHFGDGELKNEIILYAEKKLSKKTNIHYEFKGRVSNQQVLDYYSNNSIDLFVNTSDVEGIPVSIMESFSYGIPALARDVGGNSEIIINHKNGFLFPEKATYIDVYKSIENYYFYGIEKKLTLRSFAFKTFQDKYDATKNYKIFFEDLLSL